MLRRFASWTSRHRGALALAVVALLIAACIASAFDVEAAAAVAGISSFVAFTALAVGIRSASGGPDDGGPRGGFSFGDGS